MKNFKKLSVLLLLFIMGMPAFCDIVNPHLSKEQLKYRQEQLYKRYIQNVIYHRCGHILQDNISNEKADECKKILERQHKETLKLLDEMVKENQKYAAKKTENSDK